MESFSTSFNEEDLAIFIGDEAIQNKYLHSIDIILDYFYLYRECNKIYPKPELTERKSLATQY